MDKGDQLASTQAELQEVKKALQNGRAHFGMKSEELSKYLRDLNAKENILLSLQLRNLSVDGNAGGAMMPVGASGYSKDIGVPMALAGQGPPARAPPPGAAKAFDKESLPSVLTHLCMYEGVPAECAKAVRALASLAYANATLVGGDAQALPQVLRVLNLHPSEEQVRVHAVRAICNMAYDPAVALGRLTAQEVLGALVGAMSQPSHDGRSADVGTKASEALARVVAAEASPDEDKAFAAARKAAPDGPGPLASLFAAVSRGPEPWQGNAVKLVQQLVDNEVVGARVLAKRFVKAATLVQGAPASSGWLRLARLLANSDVPDVAQALIDEGAVELAAGMMQTHITDRRVALDAVETLSGLVGSRWSGLQAFADVRGLERIEEGMRSHRDDAELQTKSLRALASGMNWPDDVRKRAGYSTEHSVELTKTAMSLHVDNVELQISALEALSRYSRVMKCEDEVRLSGGEGLVKAMMARHLNDTRVQSWGRQVLESLGVDSSWQPRGVASA